MKKYLFSHQDGIEYSYDELDSFIQPYFKLLLEKGWKIRSYYVKKILTRQSRSPTHKIFYF